MDFPHNATYLLWKVIYSARRHTGIATRISITECCFTNATEIQINKQNAMIHNFITFETDISLLQVDAIPNEKAT
jgi:hypothetical protein